MPRGGILLVNQRGIVFILSRWSLYFEVVCGSFCRFHKPILPYKAKHIEVELIYTEFV